MDTWTRSKLEEWNIPEQIITIFKEEEIDRTAFYALTEEMIKELIPKIGLRSKFYNNLLELKKKDTNSQKNDDEVFMIEENIEKEHINSKINNKIDINEISNFEIIETSNITNNEIIVSSDDQNSIHKTYIRNILAGYIEGNMILNYYNCNKHLTHSMANTISSVIIKHQLKEGIETKITKNTFINLAKGIEALFPTETSYTYFIPYDKNGSKSNKGKLYDKYCNIRKKIHKITTATKHTPNETKLFVENQEYQDQITWLKNNIEPHHILYQYWESTAMGRHQHFKTNEQNAMHIFPCLKSPLGSYFIDLDFKYLYPNSTSSLLNKFDIFKNKLKKYISTNTIEKFGNNLNSIFEELVNPSKVGNDDLAALYLLPYIFSPITLKIKKTTTKHSCWRPSKAEQASAFIKFISTASDFKNTKINVTNKAVTFGYTVQPYIIIIGSVTESINVPDCFVIIENNEYKVEIPQKAVDICFKSFFSLNYNYPIEGEQIWGFIQKYFYNITTPYDKTYQSIRHIINDFNNIN